ncbi:aldehyde dehydrogenase family protein [Aliamphritea spongicola]|nr:aldehyde dehydrogenase family protein [Aliamphritea spongicola]
MILKPDQKTPLTALRIAQLATEAGLPDGVLNVLPGDGPVLGQHLCLHPGIDGQTFTGSTAVGKLLMQYSGQSNLKRTFLELGVKARTSYLPMPILKKPHRWRPLPAFITPARPVPPVPAC